MKMFITMMHTIYLNTIKRVYIYIYIIYILVLNECLCNCKPTDIPTNSYTVCLK